MSNPFADEDQIQDNDTKEREGTINPINPRPDLTDVTLLGVADEFHNQKSSYLIKMFHSAIKEHLLNPEKQFILLTNDDINMTKYTSIWANDPSKEHIKFMAVGNGDVVIRDKDMPKIIYPKDATATDYKTDPETGVQHFPTNILKFNNKDSWISDVELMAQEKRTLSIVFHGLTKVKYLGVNFVDPDKIKQKFDIIFKTDQRTELGEDVYTLAATDFENMEFDGVQLITFVDPIVTTEIVFDFKTIGAINYVIAIADEMKPEALSMFLHINRNKT